MIGGRSPGGGPGLRHLELPRSIEDFVQPARGHRDGQGLGGVGQVADSAVAESPVAALRVVAPIVITIARTRAVRRTGTERARVDAAAVEIGPDPVINA